MKTSVDPVIFIVDNNKAYQKITQQYLNIAGYQNSLIFSDYKECLDYMDLEPDIIISEYFDASDSISSETFIRLVKEKSHKTFIIFLSSRNNLENAVSLMQQGIVDYILKSKSAFDNIILHIETITRYHSDLLKTTMVNRKIAASIGILAAITGLLVLLYNSLSV